MSLKPMAGYAGAGESYSLRAAQAADQAPIKALIRAVQINPLGIHWRRFVVAVDAAGTFIGCGQVKPHRDGSRELASIAVVRSWRKQGVARAIIAHLQQAHPAPLWLTCMSPLVPFYAQFGFQEVHDVARMPLYFRRVFRLFRLFTRGEQAERYLAVMVWTGETGTVDY
ncbi:MAG: GNAT family N-acetyltransferase [Chloroflexota bacterium]